MTSVHPEDIRFVANKYRIPTELARWWLEDTSNNFNTALAQIRHLASDPSYRDHQNAVDMLAALTTAKLKS